MRIVQIIDSLDAGGAEKMAINYANALSERIDFSGLVATRKEGSLKNQIGSKVSYLFLEKKKALDFGAAFRLKKYCKEHQVEYLHAHGTSSFIAVLVKLVYPKIKIIWHDHYGMSEFLAERKSRVLKAISFLFAGIITVNDQLKVWAEEVLHCKKVIYLPNFTVENSSVQPETILSGISGKRILCLANLRHQKNHFLLLDVAEKLKLSHPEWTFHLVGKDFGDDYARQIKSRIETKNLKNEVFLYGTRNDSMNIINQAEICILTSNSEGLPVALLEYGLLKKAVISTNVGEIPLIIKDGVNGLICPVNNADFFYQSLLKIIEDGSLRMTLGAALQQTITANHSESAIMTQYLNWLAN